MNLNHFSVAAAVAFFAIINVTGCVMGPEGDYIEADEYDEYADEYSQQTGELSLQTKKAADTKGLAAAGTVVCCDPAESRCWKASSGICDVGGVWNGSLVSCQAQCGMLDGFTPIDAEPIDADAGLDSDFDNNQYEAKQRNTYDAAETDDDSLTLSANIRAGAGTVVCCEASTSRCWKASSGKCDSGAVWSGSLTSCEAQCGMLDITPIAMDAEQADF
jgi:hypothetical protein